GHTGISCGALWRAAADQDQNPQGDQPPGAGVHGAPFLTRDSSPSPRCLAGDEKRSTGKSLDFGVYIPPNWSARPFFLPGQEVTCVAVSARVSWEFSGSSSVRSAARLDRRGRNPRSPRPRTLWLTGDNSSIATASRATTSE